MKIKAVSQDINKASLEINEITPAYINSLRRTFLSKVPTMAIDYVEFHQNNSGLYDEIIAHRLGLLVLKTDVESYNVAEEGAEEGPATHLKLKLKVKGPKTVYAEDLKSSDPKVKPVHAKTPITILLEGQELELVATAKLGYGENHAKHQTGAISYYYKPTIKVNNDSDKLKETIKKIPPQIVEDGKIVKENINTANLIEACEDISDAIQITYDDPHKNFVMNIESWGHLTPKEIIQEGVKEFNKDLQEFKTKLQDLKE